jgi:hypothetical protein
LNRSDPKGRATGRVLEGSDLSLRTSSFETPAAPAPQDKEN